MSTALQIMTERRAASKAALDQILAAPTAQNRDLTAEEDSKFSVLLAEVRGQDERIAELAHDGAREASAAAVRRDFAPGASGLQSAYHTGGGLTYNAGPSSPSFFKDLIHARSGDASASERLRSNNREVGLEFRALGNTGATGGSGGEFAPPGWLVGEYIRLARPGRVTADRFKHNDLPPGVSSINVPKIATGSTVAIQSTQNTALSQTDITTAALSSSIVTHGGKQLVSRQLLDQSAIPFDKVILEDLAADHARALGTDVITGSGTGGQLRGYLTPASTSVNTWTTTSPTASAFYGRLAALQGQINGSRFKAPDTVVMQGSGKVVFQQVSSS